MLFASFFYGNEFLKLALEEKQNNNHKQALELFYKVAKENNSPQAIYEIGKYFYEGKVVKRNFDKAKEFFERSANAGFVDAKYALGIFYFNKNNPYHNYKKSYDIFFELANENHAPSQNRLGMYLAFGLDMDKDYKEAVKWFQKSSDNGYLTGTCHLALMYASGKGVFPNMGRAKVLAQDGYNQKNPVCVHVWNTFNLGNFSEDKGFFPIKKTNQ